MTHQLMKEIWKLKLKFKFTSFFICSKNWIRIFTLAYLELDYQRIQFLIKTLMKVISKAVTWVLQQDPRGGQIMQV
jgi:hypothetical protein